MSFQITPSYKRVKISNADMSMMDDGLGHRVKS